MFGSIYTLIGETDPSRFQAGGVSVEGDASTHDVAEAARIIFSKAHGFDRALQVLRIDLDTTTVTDVSADVARIVAAKLSPFLAEEDCDRDSYAGQIAFVESALGVTLDGDKWVRPEAAADWLAPYAPSNTMAA